MSDDTSGVYADGYCAAHGIVDRKWIEGAWRCYFCGEPVVGTQARRGTPDAPAPLSWDDRNKPAYKD